LDGKSDLNVTTVPLAKDSYVLVLAAGFPPATAKVT
jgi:hypothetical protein